MFTAVIAINLTISLLGFAIAWRVWQLRKTLSGVANTLDMAERSTHAVLYGAPNAIIKGQRGTRGLRQQYQNLTLQLQQVQQVLAIATFALGFWQQRGRRLRRSPSRRR